MSRFEGGQDVMIRVSHYGRGAAPVIPGKVVKVARKYGTAEWSHAGIDRTVEFALEDGYERGAQLKHYATLVMTLDEHERQDRQAAANEALRAAMIELRSGHSYTLEQQEAIVALVKTFNEDKED